MPSRSRVLLGSVAATALVVAVGVGVGVGVSHRDQRPAPAPDAVPPAVVASPDRLEDVETRGLAALRAPFCAGVTAEAVEAALGGEPRRTEAYANGETARLTPQVTDVAHEHGCLWAAAGTTARGWVFVPPVTPARARGLADGAAAARGCSRFPDAPALGEPGVALVCERGNVREASYRGLLGDAWLVCSVSAPARLDRAEHLDRTSRWCAAVLAAATGATVPG